MARRLFPVVLAALVGCNAPPQPAGGTGASRQAEEAAVQPPASPLSRQGEAAFPTFHGHTKEIDHAAFSADYSRLITVSNGDRTGRVWDARTGRELSRFDIPKLFDRGSAAGVRFSADGRKVVTEHINDLSEKNAARFRVWDADTGRLLREVRESDAETRAPRGGPARGNGTTPGVLYSGDGARKMVNGSAQVRVYDAATGKEQFAAIDRGTYSNLEKNGYISGARALAGPEGAHAMLNGTALTADGKFAVLRADWYKAKWPEPGAAAAKPADGVPIHPEYPIPEYQYLSREHLLLNLDTGEELKRAPVPSAWEGFRIYFFRGKQPLALVSNPEKTTLRVFSVFP